VRTGSFAELTVEISSMSLQGDDDRSLGRHEQPNSIERLA